MTRLEHLYEIQGELEKDILKKMILIEEAKPLVSPDTKVLAYAIVKVQRYVEESRTRLGNITRTIATLCLGSQVD